jgi:hypothetical protein
MGTLERKVATLQDQLPAARVEAHGVDSLRSALDATRTAHKLTEAQLVRLQRQYARIRHTLIQGRKAPKSGRNPSVD